MAGLTTWQDGERRQTRSPILVRDIELAELRSALAAANDQLRSILDRVQEQTASPSLEAASNELFRSYVIPDPAQGGGRSWMQSIVEELLEARKEQAVLVELREKLEADLIERTQWARKQERIAAERTRWAQERDRDLKKAYKTITKLDARNQQLEKKLGVGPSWVNPLGPGDDAKAFFKFSALIWRVTWPLRFAYRLVRRAFARGLWNPLKWPGTFRNVFAAMSEHGFRAVLSISATVDDTPQRADAESESASSDGSARAKAGSKKKRKKSRKKKGRARKAE